MRALAPPVSVISDLMIPPVRADQARASPAPEAGLAVLDEQAPPDLTVPAIPPLVAAMIAARVATAALKLSTAPRQGLILQFGAGATDQDPAWALPPCAVVLSAPTPDPRVWDGYLMSAETDYATEWDLLLQDEDEPHDPTVQMIQAWNPVRVYCPAANLALGLLSPARLAALRELVADLARQAHTRVEPRPGELVLRSIGHDHLILTGTPLLDDGQADPRRDYQGLYQSVAARLTTLTPWILSATQAPAWWQRVLAALRDAAEQWQVALSPVPVLAMGPGSGPAPAPDTRPDTLRLGDALDLQLILGAGGESVQIHATLLPGHAPVSLALLESDGLVAQQLRLDAQRASGDLWAEGGLTLTVRDEHGKGLFEACLPAALSAER